MTDEPYRLFDYYRYEDRDLFFGRDEEVARMVGDILSARLLVLFAPSGSGKSSLLRAGVQPALEKRDFDIVFSRVGEDPIASIVASVETLDSTPSRGAGDLITALTGRTKPVVVVVDQFEELFLQFEEGSAKRRDFPVKLAEALFDPSLRVYFVLSLRSEYFVSLNEFREQIPTIFHNNANLELRPFDDDAARAAIVGPSERQGSDFAWEKALPERIVRDLKALNPQKNGVVPITLQIVCHTLWSQLPEGRGEITARAYEAQGGAAAIIERRIFQTLEKTPRGDHRLVCRLLRELITKDGTKRIQTVDALHAALGEAQRKRTDALLTRFHQDLLLREELSRGETWVELRHDYLAARMKPWIEGAERQLDTRRRDMTLLAFVACAIVAAVCVWLWNDYHTYTAEIGDEQREPDPEDELAVTRRSPFLPFRVTAFSRNLLQDGGIRHNTFSVPNAPTDWSAIGEHLAKPVRDRLVLATRLDSFSVATPRQAGNTSALPNFDALESTDIRYYAAADEKVRSFALAAIEEGNAAAKRSAALALGGLLANIPPDWAPAIVHALLALLWDRDSDVLRLPAASTLDGLGANLPADRAGAVVDALLAALKDPDLQVKRSAASALGGLGANLPVARASDVVDALLAAVKDPDSGVKVHAVPALGGLGANLPADRAGAVVDALLAAVKDPDSEVKRLAAAALDSLGANLPADRAGAVVDALLAALKDPDPQVKGSAASALGRLGANLPADRAGAVVDALLAALKDPDPQVKGSAASALGRLGANLPADRAGAVVDALLAALKDPDTQVKRSAAYALGGLGANLPADRAGAVVDALLAAAFKAPDNDTFVTDPAVEALGGVKAVLSKPHADRAVTQLSHLLAAGGMRRDFIGAARVGIRELTRGGSMPPSEILIKDLESDSNREREVAIHTLARRSLSPEELKKIRALRDDPKGRPWVRMAALDTLMEIEREKDAQAREKKEEEAKAKKVKP